MKIEFQIPKSGRRIGLWQLLAAIAVLGVAIGLLPERIGFPILCAIELALIVALLIVLVVWIFKRSTIK